MEDRIKNLKPQVSESLPVRDSTYISKKAQGEETRGGAHSSPSHPCTTMDGVKETSFSNCFDEVVSQPAMASFSHFGGDAPLWKQLLEGLEWAPARVGKVNKAKWVVPFGPSLRVLCATIWANSTSNSAHAGIEVKFPPRCQSFGKLPDIKYLVAF